MDTLAFDVKRFLRLALLPAVFYKDITKGREVGSNAAMKILLKNLFSWSGLICFFILIAVGRPALASGIVSKLQGDYEKVTYRIANYTSFGNPPAFTYGPQQNLVFLRTTAGMAIFQEACVNVYPGSSINGNYQLCYVGSYIRVILDSVTSVASPCPANASGFTTCTCNTNYTPDPTATSCVSACPAHAHGTPCVCDDGYKFDTAGTSCIPEQYTISLSGLGGVVMPTKTRAAYAQVTKSDGSAKSGIPVNLALTVIEEPDGYNHAVGQHTAPHKATLLLLAGATGADGRQPFEFVAPVAGGVHTITATCAAPNCTNSPVMGTIKVPGCPVPPLTAPPFDDACATVLENLGSTQAQKDAACGTLTPALVAGRNCLSTKLSQLSPTIPLAVTSDIRSVAYQAHLRQVWDRMEDVVDWMAKNPTIQTACAARRAEIAAEKGCDNAGGCTSCYAESESQRSHCLKYRPANPSPSDAKHTEGKAFDVSQTRTIDPLQAVLEARTPPQKISQFLSAPTNCNLNWGGAFDDNVHFYVP